MRPDRLDELRATEYGYLDRDGQVYLDYTGSGLAAESQLRAHATRLREGLFGNPHSEKLCNPGAGEGAFDLTLGQLKRSRGWGVQTIDDYLLRLDLLTGGAVRVSLGIASNLADVERFLDFLRTAYRDRTAATEGLKPRLRC